MDRVEKQRTWHGRNEKEHKTNRARLRWAYLLHFHVSKEVLTRHCYGGNSPNPFWEISMLGCLSEVPLC